MLVREVMSAPAVTALASTSIKQALVLLDRNHITAMPVVDNAGRAIGVVSEADLLRDAVRTSTRANDALDDDGGRPHDVQEVMSLMALTVDVDSDLADAVDLMTTTAAKSLPVVEHGRVVGVVSRSDVIHLLARDDERIQEEIDELFHAAETDWLVEVSAGVVTVTGPSTPGESRVASVLAGSVAGVVAVEVNPDPSAPPRPRHARGPNGTRAANGRS
jgi:CBS domain-containing protein